MRISEQNVEIVRRWLWAFENSDDVFRELTHPEVEWDTQARGSDGALVYGVEGVANTIREWLEAWEDATFEVLEIRDAGDQIAAHLRQHARAKISGIEGDVDAYASFRMSDGEIVGYREHSTWSAALASVGLSD